MRIKAGWRGRVYEDFEVGDVYRHPLGRTIIAADNIWFAMLTQNTNAIHFDQVHAAKTEFGKTLVNSTFTLALVTGQSAIDSLVERHGQSRVGRGAASASGVRGRHDLFAE